MAIRPSGNGMLVHSVALVGLDSEKVTLADFLLTVLEGESGVEVTILRRPFDLFL